MTDRGRTCPLSYRYRPEGLDRVREALSGTDVSPEQWRVLAYLYDHRGCTMSELATAASLNGSTLTRVVDRLTMSAVAYRNVDPMDRRRVLVHLSSRGRALVRRLQPRVFGAEARASAALSAADVRELERLLSRIAAGGNLAVAERAGPLSGSAR